MNLIIRADAASGIGIGHVMRCIALAQKWDGFVNFVSHCEARPVLELIQSNGFQFRGVADSSAGWETIRQLANQETEQAVVFDGYGFTATDYRHANSLGLTVVAIDDNAHLPEYPVDVLVNQNPHAKSLRYLTRPDTRRLLGSEYALVRKEFTSNAEPGADEHKTPTVLITLGGSDVANLTSRIIQAARQVGGMNLIVVAGPANPRTEQLRKITEGDPAVRLENSVLDMASLMLKADVVITAAGSTCWECCCLGVPMLTIVAAENQRAIGEALVATGASVNLGWHEHVTVDLVAGKLADVVKDPATRRRMTANAKGLVDGKGAARVVKTILECGLSAHESSGHKSRTKQQEVCQKR